MTSPDILSTDTASNAEASIPANFDAAIYVEQTAALLDLSIPPTLREGVVINFEHIKDIAQPVIAFSLPETIESAATFEP